MAAPREAEKNNYFCRPGLIWFILVIYGMALATVSPFRLDLVPCEYLGPLGKLIVYLHFNQRYLLAMICVAAWFTHMLEALYANKLCTQKNISRPCRILWVIQTFICGFPSLRLLKAYEPPSSTSTNNENKNNKKRK